MHLGQSRAHLGHELRELIATLADELLQPSAFAGAHVLEALHRLIEHLPRGEQQRLGVDRGLAQHTRKAQQLDEIEPRRMRDAARGIGELREDGRELADQRGVDLECAAAEAGDTISEIAVDLAAPQLLLQARAHLAFELAQLVGQPQCTFEKTVIDAAQLADEVAGREYGFAAGEPGHAENHRGYLGPAAECNNGGLV